MQNDHSLPARESQETFSRLQVSIAERWAGDPIMYGQEIGRTMEKNMNLA